MNNKQVATSNRQRTRGQSLVEIALILPFMVLIIAGVVEVSNMLITKNRVESAARAAARFAASGGQAVDVIVLNTVTQTLDLSEGVWDIFFLKGVVNEGGDGFTSWEIEHIYGLSQTTSYTEVATTLDLECGGDCLPDRVLYDLQTNEQGNHIEPVPGSVSTQIAANLSVVSVVVIHDINSILGLNVIPAFADVMSIQGIGVMRLAGFSNVDETSGCVTAFPIILSQGPRSLEEQFFPDEDDFIAPIPPPTWNRFTGNVAGNEINLAREGYIYQFSFTTDQIAWLRWNEAAAQDGATLSASLDWPGNLPHPTLGFTEITDNLDHELQLGDRVAASDVALGSVSSVIEEHINLGRVLRVLATNETNATPRNDLPGKPPYFVTDSFVNIRIAGYGSDWLLIEFVSKDSSCGQ